MSYSPKHSFKDGFVLKTFQYTEKWLTGCLAQNTEPQTPINSRWHCYAFQIATIFLKTREVYVSTQNGHKTMSNHKVIKVSEHSFSRTLVCSLKFSLMPGWKCAHQSRTAYHDIWSVERAFTQSTLCPRNHNRSASKPFLFSWSLGTNVIINGNRILSND